MTNQSHTELAARALRMARAQIKWLAFGECRADGWEGPPPTAAQAVAAIDAALESPERGQGEARLQQECDTITELNHAQWLALGKASLLVAACNRLSAEAEEFDFDDGLGRGAQQAYWDEFESALEHAMEAMDIANKTTQRIHATPPTAPAQSLEQALRDALEAMGSKKAQELSAGDLMAVVCDVDASPQEVPAGAEINIHLLWRDACKEWGEACGGPDEYEIFADKLLAALRASTPAERVPLTTEQRRRVIATVSTVGEAIDLVEAIHGIKGSEP